MKQLADADEIYSRPEPDASSQQSFWLASGGNFPQNFPSRE